LVFWWLLGVVAGGLWWVVVLCVVVSCWFPAGAWFPVDPTFLYGAGGGAGAWWFYIAVAIAPITAINTQYIIIGIIIISISSTC